MKQLTRREFTSCSSALAISSLIPNLALANTDKLPLSNFGFATEVDEVVAGINLQNKTILITGCNSGLGFESMRALASRGAHVIGTARNMQKARIACDSVQGNTTPMVCELTNFDSVIECCDKVISLNKPLDVLMTNAGIMAPRQLEQFYGLEKQFVVNHLSHFLMFKRLLSRLQEAEHSRVVALSSIGYRNAPAEGIQFDNLNGEKGYKPFTFYGQSKLANALFARELARRYKGSNMTANSVHPGLVATNLGRYVSGKPKDPNAPLRKGFKTPSQGASSQVYVAVDARLKDVSGYYFEDCNPVEPSGPHMLNDDLALKLWETSEELIRDYV
ncbi:MAG: SDR family NAD(P)-dependent oxidoreductase [Pseudomonadota bacterium]|nr:SDR family NAD(P)-dependent oxidoreductase [Pseudomonadota bacterium]